VKFKSSSVVIENERSNGIDVPNDFETIDPIEAAKMFNIGVDQS